MAGFFGSDFDASQPPDSAPRRDGASWLRDIRTRLKTFLGVSFDLETGELISGSVTGASLETISGLTPGDYVGLSIDGKGRVTAAVALTTLADYGITDALGSADIISSANGGTGALSAPASDGLIPVSDAAGVATWSALSSADGSIVFAFGAGTIDLSAAAAAVTPFFAVVTVPYTSGVVDLVTGVAGKKAFVTGASMYLPGASWAGASVELQIIDSAGSPVVFAGATVAQLVTGAYLDLSDFTLYTPFQTGAGSTTGEGISARITGGVATSGGDVTIVVSGILK